MLFNNKNLCSGNYSVVIYIKTQATLDSIFYYNAIYIVFSTEGSPARAHVDALRASASLMSVQFQSRTPSVDPAVENYFCNTVHLACEYGREVAPTSALECFGSNCLANCPNWLLSRRLRNNTMYSVLRCTLPITYPWQYKF